MPQLVALYFRDAAEGFVMAGPGEARAWALRKQAEKKAAEAVQEKAGKTDADAG